MATVGVRFRPSERLRYVDDAGHDVKVGDVVSVEGVEQAQEGHSGSTDATGTPQTREAIVALDPGQVIFSELRETQGSVTGVVTRAQSQA
jgi:hypothetical protein